MIPTHRHADGDLYQLVETCKMKHPDTGDWLDAISYRGEDGKMRTTSKARWEERFIKLEFEPSHEEEVEVGDEDGVFASFSFTVFEAGDVRTMLLNARPQRNSNANAEMLHWLKIVLSCQADAVTKGLHVRDHDFPDLIGDVSAFHAKFGQEYTGKPRALPTDLHEFRTGFHLEETTEYADEYSNLLEAIERKDRRDIINSLELQLDALVDSVWVLIGTADLQFGRAAFIEAWKRVVSANMAKVRKDLATNGHEDSGRAPKYDIVKPAGWVAPDHRDLVTDNAVFDEIFDTPAIETNGTVQEA